MGPASPATGMEPPCAAPYDSLRDPWGPRDLLGLKAARRMMQPSPQGARGVPALSACCSGSPRACEPGPAPVLQHRHQAQVKGSLFPKILKDWVSRAGRSQLASNAVLEVGTV